ncbi:uroporphyrinogen-III C-methyltransferase [Bacillus atrophaeus]|uniref:uroporphyrinogen-III C-methyltransferase n=1 Tax=Bacillus atrophaeus TaxID=1452 RepID=UPI002E2385F9|nr:uroporphyrinogen-III C-methyltransferase [Bacillus atrophaeus]MED4821540.1 uroporphyrinogen-III C-methyltransferase [Bacillus atrophaeus]MED4857497.1 uroporphyrinogen-III C-methyltransferase [Bacillus atrophaeus]
MKNGIVYFVGAGPGDPRLITLKGKQALEEADVILYDRLANPKLLEYAQPACHFIYCGKLPDRHFMKQAEINALLIEKASEGLTVVRLKGGDPSVFGRVGEEAEALHQHGIRYEMVPGITSGIAAPLYAGIPVTHRDFASSFAMITAHDTSLKGTPNLDWEGLARGVQTLVFYMGVKNLAFICQQLIAYGKSPSVPVMVIQWGTWGRQRSVKGTLIDIHQKAADEQIKNPAIIVIGDIVSFQKHSWFESKPLIGRHIMMITSGEEESPIAKELRENGADVIEWPKWNVQKTPIDENILNRLESFEDILFTSRRAVCEFFRMLASKKMDIRQLRGRLSADSLSAKAELEKRGFDIASNIQYNVALLIIGEKQTVQERFHHLDLCSSYDVFITHENVIDDRFTSIFKRTIDETPLQLILCENKKCMEQLIREKGQIGVLPEQSKEPIPVVCLSEEAEETARQHGFPDVHRVKADGTSLIDYIHNHQHHAEKRLLHT